MFNSPVLDVFIGLVLIYLLYSLLITIVSEIVVSWMGLRSRILRVSIEKMLNDGYYDKRDVSFGTFTWYLLQRFFLKEFPEFKNSFAGKFYDYPAIKYLAARAGERKTLFTETKPSYLSDEIFADTLIQILKKKGSGNTDFDKVKFALSFNTYQVQPATLKRLRDLAENSGDDIVSFKENLKSWYNETQDRATGWFKRKLQLILFWMGFIVAVIFNVDSLRIAKILAKDEKARDQLVAMGVQLAKDSARYSAFLTKHDSLPQAVLDSGYSRITKDIQEANLVLGLGWGTSVLTESREETVDISKAGIKNQQTIFQSSQNNIRKSGASVVQANTNIDAAEEELSRLEIDSLKTGDSTTFHKLMDSVRKSLRQYRAQKRTDSLIIVHSSTRLNQVPANINRVLKTNFVIINSIDSVSTTKILVKGERHCYWYEKFFYVLGGIFRDYRFVGFFITGLMISLGAPFWFDLLKKLVSIRGDGVKPEEKKVTNTDVVMNENVAMRISPVQTSGLDIIGDAADEALKIYHDLIRRIPGVKSVFLAKERATQEKYIQVNVDTDITKEEVQSKFPILRVGGVTVKQKIIVSGVPVSHIGEEGTISNKSGKNGFGTIGCQLKCTDTGETQILSCWHVMKGNRRYDFSDPDNKILDHNRRECAERWAGGIEDAFDYAIASYPGGASTNFNNFLKQKLGITGEIGFREIDRTDIENMISVKYYDCLGRVVRHGFIHANSAKVTINYFDRDRVLNDLLLITNDENQSISRGGNSGSIVFDDNNMAIAMIISGDRNFTYAVKLSHIFNIHDEMIIA